ncbi:MAG: hypothetical protein ABIR26_14735 [Ramlibacter sp.]
MLKLVPLLLAICLAACGGGGGDSSVQPVANIQAVANKQVVTSTQFAATTTASTARTIYGDIDPSYMANITWTELIGLPEIIDFTYQVPLRTLIDGGPIGQYERGSLALLLTTDPSPTILISAGHLEARAMDTPAPVFKDQLREAVGIVRAAGKVPEIRGLHHVTGLPQQVIVRFGQLDKAAEEVARELGVKFYDVGSLPWSPQDLEADGFHPTLEYSRRIGEFLRSQMQ